MGTCWLIKSFVFLCYTAIDIRIKREQTVGQVHIEDAEDEWQNETRKRANRNHVLPANGEREREDADTLNYIESFFFLSLAIGLDAICCMQYARERCAAYKNKLI